MIKEMKMSEQNPKFKKGEKVYALFEVLNYYEVEDEMYSNNKGETVACYQLCDGDSDTVIVPENIVKPITKTILKEMNSVRRKELQDQIKKLQKELDSLS
jgi:hypothetical protein